MEDSVTENEKLQLQVLTSVDENEKEGGAKQVIIDGEEKPGGGGGGGGKEQEQEKEMGEMGEMGERNSDVGEKPIGLINQIISSFAPAGDKEGEEEEIDNKVKVSVGSEEKEEENRGGGGGGGLFSHIISNLVSSPAEKDGNGIIDNIVSNLPPPLPDDAAPASDEASILIHSIIHD